MKGPVWINGKDGGHLDPADRGLAYGDGLFETLRVEKSRAVLAEAHFSRLQYSAAALGIPLDIAALCRDFSRFLTHCAASGVAKIIVTRGVSGRGYLPDPAARPTVIFSMHDLPEYPAAHAAEGITAAVCTQRLGKQPLLAGHKHLNRLEQVLLRRELAALQADEALVCDIEGVVIEGVSSNVFFVRDGVLHTPLLATAGVHGVLRAALMDFADGQGIAVHEALYGRADFMAADEVFFCNSVNGVWPVARLHDGHSERHWRPGALTRRLQDFWQEQLGL
jgi:4-amino-4-deoxychorismate lyase